MGKYFRGCDFRGVVRNPRNLYFKKYHSMSVLLTSEKLSTV